MPKGYKLAGTVKLMKESFASRQMTCERSCFAVSPQPLPVERHGVTCQAAVRTLDGIIDTVSAKHEISQLLPLLDVDGTLVLLGVPPEPHTFAANSVQFSRCAALALATWNPFHLEARFCGMQLPKAGIEKVHHFPPAMSICMTVLCALGHVACALLGS